MDTKPKGFYVFTRQNHMERDKFTFLVRGYKGTLCFKIHPNEDYSKYILCAADGTKICYDSIMDLVNEWGTGDYDVVRDLQTKEAPTQGNGEKTTGPSAYHTESQSFHSFDDEDNYVDDDNEYYHVEYDDECDAKDTDDDDDDDIYMIRGLVKLVKCTRRPNTTRSGKPKTHGSGASDKSPVQSQDTRAEALASLGDEHDTFGRRFKKHIFQKAVSRAFKQKKCPKTNDYEKMEIGCVDTKERSTTGGQSGKSAAQTLGRRSGLLRQFSFNNAIFSRPRLESDKVDTPRSSIGGHTGQFAARSHGRNSGMLSKIIFNNGVSGKPGLSNNTNACTVCKCCKKQKCQEAIPLSFEQNMSSQDNIYEEVNHNTEDTEDERSERGHNGKNTAQLKGSCPDGTVATTRLSNNHTICGSYKVHASHFLKGNDKEMKCNFLDTEKMCRRRHSL